MKEYRIQIQKGKLVDRNSFLEYLVNQEDGFYNVFVEKTQVGQAKYFHYRDIVADYLGYNTSAEKKDLHNYLKRELLPLVFKDPDNLNISEDLYHTLAYSTKFLSDKGWFDLNKSFEIYAMSKWEVLLN
jgi:hypothetical protein